MLDLEAREQRHVVAISVSPARRCRGMTLLMNAIVCSKIGSVSIRISPMSGWK